MQNSAAKKLRALIGKFSVILAIFAGLAMPVGFFVAEYYEDDRALNFKAKLIAHRVSEYAYAHPRMWQYHDNRLGDLADLYDAFTEPVLRRVYDARDRLVFQDGELGNGLSMVRSYPVVVSGQTVGRIEVEARLLPLWTETLIVLVLGLGLGVFTFFVARTLPLSVLDRALTELNQAKEAVEATNAELRVRNEMLLVREEQLRTQNLRFDAALKNLSQGLAVFDTEQRLIICNERYGDLYGLPSELRRPGISLQQILDFRIANGIYAGSPDEYKASRSIKPTVFTAQIDELSDGRFISICRQPMPDGGWLATHEDITERRRADAAIKKAHAEVSARNKLLVDREDELWTQNLRFDVALKHMSQGLAVFDENKDLVLCNERYATMYGLPEELTKPGTPGRKILEARVANGVYVGDSAQYISSRLSGDTFESKVDELTDGRFVAVALTKLPDGGFLVTHEDITARCKADAEIARLARQDALTGLSNRRAFRERLDQIIAELQASDQIAIMFADLDAFKPVNDTLGHPIGDRLLAEVAERLVECVGETGVVARVGGDEFAILQKSPDQPREASALAQRIVEEMAKPFDIEGHHIVIGACVGIALAPRDGMQVDQLLKHADLALYAAKAEGSGVFQFFEPGMDEAVKARHALERDLRLAMVAGQFELYYQPLINAQTLAIAGFEALLRWHRPGHGMVSPGEFIPLAERTGLIVQIGEWVLRQACADAASWPIDIKLAVNLSATQFKNRNLVPTIMNALAASGLSASRLEVEITESVFLNDTADTLATLHRLRGLGVGISMDDFGTGYSALSYLHSFPFNKIKIDKCFVQGLAGGGDPLAIVRAVTGLSATLGMTTTAEGVETAEQLERVRAEGCTEVQGFYFSKPKPLKELAPLLDQTRGRAVA